MAIQEIKDINKTANNNLLDRLGTVATGLDEATKSFRDGKTLTFAVGIVSSRVGKVSDTASVLQSISSSNPTYEVPKAVAKVWAGMQGAIAGVKSMSKFTKQPHLIVASAIVGSYLGPKGVESFMDNSKDALDELSKDIADTAFEARERHKSIEELSKCLYDFKKQDYTMTIDNTLNNKKMLIDMLKKDDSSDAFSTLQIANEANDKFIVTRADINESLEDIFSIECFAYINLVKNPLYENLESIYNDNAQTGIYRYLDKGMKLSIKRPSSTNKSIIPSNNGSDYIYFSGIVSDVEYLGVDDDSSTNIDKKYFFKFKLTSSLYRLSINRANRIYTDQSVLEVVKEILSFNKQRLTKELDFSNIKNSYNKK